MPLVGAARPLVAQLSFLQPPQQLLRPETLPGQQFTHYSVHLRPGDLWHLSPQACCRVSRNPPHSILKELHLNTPLRFQGKPDEGQRQRKARGRNPVPPNPRVPPRNLSPPSPKIPKRRSKTAESTTETGPNAQSARNTTGKRPWNAAGPPRNSGFASTAAASPYPARPDAKTAPSGTGLTAGRMTPSEDPSGWPRGNRSCLCSPDSLYCNHPAGGSIIGL